MKRFADFLVPHQKNGRNVGLEWRRDKFYKKFTAVIYDCSIVSNAQVKQPCLFYQVYSMMPFIK
jgi:hypothetical protein